MAPIVSTGLDQCIANQFALFRGQRVALLINQASCDHQFRHLADLIKATHQVHLVRIFGPEHGFAGVAQDLENVIDKDHPHPHWGVPVLSLYGETESSLTPDLNLLQDIDTLIVDLPDIGTRYYTFAATMIRILRAASGLNLRVTVLDRPNPLGSIALEGPILKPGFESFVGEIAIPIRHAMTLGEIGRWVLETERIDLNYECISTLGWSGREMLPETGLPWVMPSPNMPTFETALVYPGGCLIEGTNLSEGRGTTRPFEILGAPWIHELKLANRLNQSRLDGFIARPIQFKPTFQKHSGQVCGGVQIHVTDRLQFQPVRVYTAAIIAMRDQNPELFQWRTETYEFRNFPIAIDLLYGSDSERVAIESGATWQELAESWTIEELEFSK
ncbi:MAG: DUF1343 domain-containing protein [Planctomycetota bacterium]|nr:MAG: DUF1343 domain-containing protein [Planctomycetota bacterium]